MRGIVWSNSNFGCVTRKRGQNERKKNQPWQRRFHFSLFRHCCLRNYNTFAVFTFYLKRQYGKNVTFSSLRFSHQLVFGCILACWPPTASLHRWRTMLYSRGIQLVLIVEGVWIRLNVNVENVLFGMYLWETLLEVVLLLILTRRKGMFVG